MKSKKEMVRILKKKSGEISVDATGRENGRGAYICTESNCLMNIRRSKGLERSFKMRVNEEDYERLTKELDAIRDNKRRQENI
ncbi:MAG: YlxR family protein [Lachnospiraceae bacterium]|nr:YlxR family protein [Lachnospiraceae bacterium]